MKKIFFYSLILILLVSGFAPAHAQEKYTYTLLEPLPCIEGTGNNCEKGKVIDKISLDDYIGYVFKFALALAVFLATIVIIWGGFEYMFSEAPFVKVNAKGRIKNAILGLIGALVSFLILQTIDPRLVQINTSIPKINIQISKETESFQAQLSKDLTRLTQEKKYEIYESTIAISDLQKTKKDLDTRFARDEIDEEEYNVSVGNINNEIKKIKASQYNLIASENGLYGFNKAYSILNNPDPDNLEKGTLEQYTAKPVPNTLANRKYPVNSPNIIQNQYNIEINKLLADTGNGEMAQTLGRQRDFYIELIQDEVELTDKIKTHGKYISTGGQGIGITVNNKQYFETKLEEYETNLTDSQAYIDAGVSKEMYDNVIKARINIINQTLNPPKKE
ncbi:MAG: pilin [bacterium]|nr:pilin [bacterium]